MFLKKQLQKIALLSVLLYLPFLPGESWAQVQPQSNSSKTNLASTLWAAQKSKPTPVACDPGLGGFMKALMSIPYAVGSVVLYIFWFIFGLIALVLALLCIVFYALAWGILLISPWPTEKANFFFRGAKYFWKNKGAVGRVIDSFDRWYSGNCSQP